MTPTILERGTIAPGVDEQPALTEFREYVFRHLATNMPARLISPNNEMVELPPSLYRVIQAAVDVLNRGEAIAIVPIHKELTTQQAADILNLSRQYFVRLLDGDRIPYTKAGTHRRIKFGDVMSYKAERDRKRQSALDDLTRQSQELGLYE